MVSVTAGILLAAGLSGRSTFSTGDAPIDCKTQAAAGKSDNQIAAAYNQSGMQQTRITVADVAGCHETSGNKSAEMIPSNY